MTTQIKPSIFINPTFKIDEKTKSCDKIGSIWARLRDVNTIEEAASLMSKLGVDGKDKQAQTILFPIIQNAFNSVDVIPSQTDSGVFFLSSNGNIFAVFKIGEKRARMELLARSIAHRVGLEKYAIPGVACSIQNPKFPDDEVQVELFNGNIKTFRSFEEKEYNQVLREENFGLEKPFIINGILEPFISENPDISKEEFFEMVFYSLIIGLRDGKTSGRKGALLFDVEDCMPARFIPDSTPDRNVAATHLPLLEHELASEEIPLDVLKKLAKKIDDESILLMLNSLDEERVEIADLAGESFEPADDTFDQEKQSKSSFEDRGWDDGGCPVQVEEPHLIMDKYPRICVESQAAKLLTDNHIAACSGRIERLRRALKESIDNNKPLTTIDLVCAVDPFYKAQLDSLQRADYQREFPFYVIGRYTPRDTGICLSSSELESFLKSIGVPERSQSEPELRNASKSASQHPRSQLRYSSSASLKSGPESSLFKEHLFRETERKDQG